MHRFNDIPPYPPPMDYIAVLPLSACPVYHAIVIPSHVLNIITIMNTLKNISLYINAISPHRAANPTLSSRRVFRCLFPAPFPCPISPAVRFPPAPVNCRPTARRLSWRNLREPAAHQGCHRGRKEAVLPACSFTAVRRE